MQHVLKGFIRVRVEVLVLEFCTQVPSVQSREFQKPGSQEARHKVQKVPSHAAMRSFQSNSATRVCISRMRLRFAQSG